MVSNDKNEGHDPLDFIFLSKEDEECDSSIIGKTAADSTEITHHGLFPMPHYPVLPENIHSTNQSNVQDIHGVSGFLTTTDLSPQSNTLSNHLVAQDSVQHEKVLSFSPESRLPMPLPSLIQKQIPRTNKSDNMGIPLSGSVLKEDSIHSNTLLCSPIVENSPHVEGNISNLPKAVRFYSSPADNSNAAHQYMNATHNMASFDNSVANLNTFPNYKINGNFTEHNEGGRLQMTRPLGEDNSKIYENLIGSNFINPTERIPVSHHSPTSGDIATAKNGLTGAVQVDYANKLHGSILAHGTAGRTVKHTPNANILDGITGNVGNIYPNSHVQLESTSSLNHACGFSDYSSSQGTGFSRIAHSIGEGDQNSSKGRGKMALGKVRNVESGNMKIYPNASPIPYSSNPIWHSEVSEGLNYTPQQIYGQLQNWNAQKNLNTLPQTSMPSKFDGTEGRTTRNLAGRGSLTLGKRRNIESGKIATPPSASSRSYSRNPVRLAESTKGLKFAPRQSSGQLQNWNEQTYVNILPQSSQFDGVTGNTAMNEGLGKLGRPLDSAPHPSPGKPRPSFVSGLIFPSVRNSGLVHGSNAFSGASPNVRQYNRNFLSNMDPLGPRPSPGPGMPIAKGSEIAQTFNGFDGPAVKRRTIRPPPAVRCSQRRNTTFIPSADTSNQSSPQTRPCLSMQSQNQALSIRMKPPVPTVPPSLINPINSPTPVAHIQWKGPRETPQLKGQNCPCCKRDLSCTPDGPLYLPTGPPVAVLPCGHVFHDHCLELITPQDQSHNPMCILCAIGEPLN